MPKTIVKTIAGSHLFGLNTPSSDMDYKGVFQEELKNIVLGKDSKQRIENTNKSDKRNTKDDVDVEMKELRKFIRDCIAGQTYALEMLYCPDDKIIETSNEWKFIQTNRQKLTTNNLNPFIGYAFGQSQKYSLRGTRLKEMERVYEWFTQQPPNSKLFEVIDTLELSQYTYKETYLHKHSGQVENQLVCLGIVLQENKYIKECIPSLKKRLMQYGERSKTNKDNGEVDWKAYSHAFRLVYEWEQLLLEGKLSFPIPNKEFILNVKLGKMPFDEVQDVLFSEFERISKIPNNLPEPDVAFWDDFILSIYL